MDGTVYLDDTLLPHALDFLDAVRRRGGDYIFLTNNSSRNVQDYLQKLARLGIPAGPENVLTSAEALCMELAHRYGPGAGGRPVYIVGTSSLKETFWEAGFTMTRAVGGPGRAEILVVGFDRELTFQKLEDACKLLTSGIPYFATNPDWVCPTAWGYVPDCGSFCEMLKRATGREPYVVGKPRPDMVRMALSRFGLTEADAVLVGDRLYTDIACGQRAAIDTVFVLTGEGTLADLEKSDVKPTYVATSVEEIWRNFLGGC